VINAALTWWVTLAAVAARSASVTAASAVGAGDVGSARARAQRPRAASTTAETLSDASITAEFASHLRVAWAYKGRRGEVKRS
jgi:hypothetical protein